MSVAAAEKLYTEEEYLAQERTANHKSELINGRICAMAGAGEPHVVATGNVFAELRAQFRGRSCLVYSSEMRVRVNATGLYTYPDVVAVCGEPVFLDDHRDTLLNPTVIVEILSPSTEAYDRGEILEHYGRLPSIRDILFVSQDRVRVEHFVRETGGWHFTEYTHLADEVQIDSIEAALAVREIYDKVNFPPATKGPTQP